MKPRRCGSARRPNDEGVDPCESTPSCFVWWPRAESNHRHADFQAAPIAINLDNGRTHLREKEPLECTEMNRGCSVSTLRLRDTPSSFGRAQRYRRRGGMATPYSNATWPSSIHWSPFGEGM